MTQEQIYLQDKDIFISSTLIKTGSFTYQVKNITSYRVIRGGGTIFTMAPFLIGLAVLAMAMPTGNQFSIGCGAALIVLGMAMFFCCKTLYLMTSAEQGRAFTTYNTGRMVAVINALDQAISKNRT